MQVKFRAGYSHRTGDSLEGCSGNGPAGATFSRIPSTGVRPELGTNSDTEVALRRSIITIEVRGYNNSLDVLPSQNRIGAQGHRNTITNHIFLPMTALGLCRTQQCCLGHSER